MTTFRLPWLAAALLLATACAKEPILPRSYAAEVQETLDPARVQLIATGLGEEFEFAVHDAQKAAMARLIQDMVQTPEEKTRFDFVETQVFGQYVKYIERWELRERRVAPDGDVQVRGEVVVNRRLLEDDLVRLGVVKERRELLAELEHPTMAVLPDEGVAAEPWAEFASNHAGSYLTQRRYEVVDLQQLRAVEQMAANLQGVSGVPSDPKAVIALQAGTDIYAVYDVRLDRERVGKDETVKASASVKAFETTTARQIGAASGFSKGYAATAGAQEKAVAEALGDAFDRLLTNVEDYWKTDLKQGHQFLLTIRGTFGAQDPQARRAVHRAVEQTTTALKENLSTDQTLNYRVWFAGSNTDLLFALQDRVAEALPGAELHEQTTNRKLLVLELER